MFHVKQSAARRPQKRERSAMFREVVRVKQAMTREECVEILKSEVRGVLSVNGDDGYPYGIPHNHWYNEADGKIYFHSGKKGHKIDAIRADGKVSYCVTRCCGKREGEWWLNFESVVVFGRVEFIEDYDKALQISKDLSYKFTDDEEYIQKELDHSGPGVLVFALVPEHITGKRVNER